MATQRSRGRAASTHAHVVRAQLKVHELSKTGTSLLLEILQHGEKIGELEIGRGSLFWRGARRQNRKRIRWGRFAELMDRLAYGDA
jgi:hypothetical protein